MDEKVRVMGLHAGMWAKYRGHWAYVVSVNTDGEVMLSMWQGIKTTVAKLSQIKEWGPEEPKS